MNSYPPEPLMFVAGLGTDPAPAATAAPTSPPAASSSSSSPSRPQGTPERHPSTDGEFGQLLTDLRHTLRPYQHPARVWLPPQERRQFRVELVDRNVALPARKAPAAGDGRAHSPLSPLSPGSPMYPDGLIAPVWVRKHAEAIPAVFVSFMRLYEPPPPAGGASPLGHEMIVEAERAAERQADENLVAEISELRKRLAERGVKLTVVLIASAQTLDSPGLDSRLSNLRRSAGLGAKGSLFVLTPVPAAELPDFVRSLQDALWEPALEYYAAHGKRVRQKRGRVPANIGERGRARSGSNARARSGSFVRPLGQQGWIVRYDFKAGWFAEARGELDLARRHYEDCWNELARMFGSTTTLPPRTKRWAEAKVLADCVAIKICKLLLYEGSGSRVMVPFFVHVRRFADLSRGWGIGEETFEFWSWVARQYRLFGEMLELAIRHGYRVPPMPLPQMSTPTVPPTPEVLISAVNPLHILHSPAYYFYAAATCTMERKARFDAALAAERETGAVALAGAPGFANEKGVDHAALIIELLTKARALGGPGAAGAGLELYDAYRVAETYVSAGKYAEGAKYLADIVNKFPSWGPITRELQALQLQCVRETGDTGVNAALVVQMLAPGWFQNRAKLVRELNTLMEGAAPSDPIVIDMPKGQGLLSVRAGFRLAEAPSGTPLAFQVQVGSSVDLAELPVTALRIVFSDDHEITLSPGGEQFVDLGEVGSSASGKAALQFSAGSNLIISGKISGEAAGWLEVSDVIVCIGSNGWVLDVGLKPEPLTAWTTRAGSYAPLTGLHDTVEITPRQPSLDIALSHPSVMYVGEDVPITATVTADEATQLVVSAMCGEGPVRITHGTETGDGQLVLDVPAGESTQEFRISSPRAGECRVAFTSGAGTGDVPVEGEVAVLSAVPPFRVSPSIRNIGQQAVVSAALRVGGERGVQVRSITALGEGKVDDSLGAESFPQTWTQDTAFALCARFALGGKVVPGLKVVWRPLPTERSEETSPAGGDGASGAAGRRDPSSSSDDNPFLSTPSGSSPIPGEADITTVIPLPPIHAPQPESFLTAEAQAPASVRLNDPFVLTLTVRNSHPTESVWGIISGETSEHFVWTGPRGVRLAVAPRGEEKIEMRLVAVSGVGNVAWPGISVREGDGEEVEVRKSGVMVLP